MGKKTWIDSDHFVETSDDGRQSRTYRDGGWLGTTTCVDITDHHSDGTSTSYEPREGVIETWLNFGDDRGSEK